MTQENKNCSICKQSLPLEEFYLSHNGMYNFCCKPCDRKRKAVYRAENKEIYKTTAAIVSIVKNLGHIKEFQAQEVEVLMQEDQRLQQTFQLIDQILLKLTQKTIQFFVASVVI